MIAGSDIAKGCASSLTEMRVLLAEPRQQRAPGRIGKCCKGAVEGFVLILNHVV